MLARETSFTFRSPLRHWMTKFIQEKRGLGWRYETEYNVLCRLDRHLCEIELDSERLTRQVVDDWTAAMIDEKPATQGVRLRLTRQFAQYLVRQGIPAYCPPERTGPSRCSGYTPYIFTHYQSAALLAAVDRLEAEGHAPLRHRIMPEVFRLLYGSGMRINEVLHLRVADVDLDRGILTVRDGKPRRDSLCTRRVGDGETSERLRIGTRPAGSRRPLLPGAGRWALFRVFGLHDLPHASPGLSNSARWPGTGAAHARPAAHFRRPLPGEVVPRGCRPRVEAPVPVGVHGTPQPRGDASLSTPHAGDLP